MARKTAVVSLVCTPRGSTTVRIADASVAATSKAPAAKATTSTRTAIDAAAYGLAR